MVFRRRKITDRIQSLVDEVLHILQKESAYAVGDYRPTTIQVARLEQRVLMSASPLVVVAAATADAVGSSVMQVSSERDSSDALTADGEQSVVETESQWDSARYAITETQDPDANELVESATADTNRTPGAELVVIDYRVQDADTLLENLLKDGRDVRLLRLDADTDGLQQITEKLEQVGNVSAIHLLTHGRDGEILLGSTHLNSTTLAQYSPELLAWQHSLTANADIMLYGCDLAVSAEGRDFVESLRILTGADVAASTDATGSQRFGGDWELEFQLGAIETHFFDSSVFNDDWNDLLGVITVSTTNDVLDGDTSSVAALLASKGTDGFISLREAIIASNNTVGADTIFLTAGTFTLSIGGQGENSGFTGDLDITDSLTITGAGSGLSTIDAGSLDRVIELWGTNTTTIEDVTIRGGSTASNEWGGGILTDNGSTLNLSRVVVTGNSTGSGAGIYNYGTLIATDTVISNNTASDWGGGLYNDSGIVTLNRVTISGNTAGKDGGGIENTGSGSSMSLTNVTISGNTATNHGGGIWTSRTITATNSTIAFNTAAAGDGIFMQGGAASVSLRNSVLHNPAGVNSNQAITSLGNNIDSDGTAGLTGPGDLVTDPQLAALANYGGMTPTHALRASSPAINAGTASGAPATDQRGANRLGAPDIGAFEYTVIGYEPFSYAAGSFNGANGGSGWAAGWSNVGSSTTIAPTGLIDPLTIVPTSGGAAMLTIPSVLGNITQTRELATTIGTTSTTTWLSFLIKPNSTLPSEYLGLLFGSPSASRAFAGYNGNEFVLEQVGGSGRVTVSGIAPSAGQTYLLTVKIDFTAGADTMTLYVNPTPGLSAPDSSFTATKNNLDLGTFTQIGLNGGRLLSANNSQLDEIRIGGKYIDIAPANAVPGNNAPVVTTTAGAISYTENAAAIAVDPGLTVSDVDSSNLTAATIAISNNYSNGQDLLAFTNRLGITGNWDAATGIMSLSGTATVADYQTALRSVTYSNSSDAPTTLPRSVSFTVSDGIANSAAATCSITLTAVNDAPNISSNGGGANAAISVAENTTAVTTVVATDADLPAQTLTYSISGGADASRFAINSTTGVLTFVSARNFESPADNGSNNVYDVIVRVSDGMLTDTQAIAVIITNANDNAPVINAGQSFSASELAANGTSLGRVAATDADGSTTFSNWTITGGNNAGIFAINSATGALFIANSTGLDYETTNAYSLTISVSDGVNTSLPQTVSIAVLPVNDNTPVITSNGAGATAAISVAENAVAVTTVTATDADLPSQDLIYSISGGSDAASFSIDSNTGILTFVTAPDYENPADNGTNNIYKVTVQVTDGTRTDTQAIEVTVTPVNDNTPVITSSGGGSTAFLSVAENTTAVTTVSATDADLPSQDLIYSISGGSDAARFSINSNTGVLRFLTASDFETPTDTGSDGIYNIVVHVTDGAWADTQTIDVSVTNVNERPVANAESYSVNEDTTLTIGGAGVLTNDTDPENGALNVVLIDGVSHGSLTLNSDGSFAYTPDSNFYGQDSFRYAASDEFLNSLPIVVTLNILAVNDAPVVSLANSQITYTEQASARSLDSSPTISDIDNSNLTGATVTITNGLASGPDELIFTSVSGITGVFDAATDTLTFSGTASVSDYRTLLRSVRFCNLSDTPFASVRTVTVQVTDGTATGSDFRNIQVTAVNDAPVITSNGGSSSTTVNVNEYTTAVTTVTSFDVDGGVASYVIAGGNDQDLFQINTTTGILEFDTAQSFLSPIDANGDNVYEVQVRAIDGNGGSDTQSLQIHLKNVNETPLSTPVPTVSVLEDSSPFEVSVASSFTDPDLDLLTCQITNVTSGSSLFDAISIDATTGIVSLDLRANASGTSVITLRATDPNGLLTTTQLTVIVQAVNDAPIVQNYSGSLFSGQTLSASGSGVLQGAVDVEGQTIQAVLINGPQHGTVTLDSNGRFFYRPNAGYFGADSFTYAGTDGVLVGPTATASINVLAPFSATTNSASSSSGSSSGSGSSPASSSSSASNSGAGSQSASGSTAPRGTAASVGSTSSQTSSGTGQQSQSTSAGSSVPSNAVTPAGQLGLTAATAATSRADDDAVIGLYSQKSSASTDTLLIKTSISNASTRLLDRDESRRSISSELSSRERKPFYSDWDSRRESTALERQREQVYLNLAVCTDQQINFFEEKLTNNVSMQGRVVGSVGVVTTGFSVGYLIWAVRGGMLLSGVLSQIPAWTMLDPLMVIDGDGKDDDKESLQTLLDRQQAKLHSIKSETDPGDG